MTAHDSIDVPKKAKKSKDQKAAGKELRTEDTQSAAIVNGDGEVKDKKSKKRRAEANGA